MEIEKNKIQLKALIGHWEKQNIKIEPANTISIERAKERIGLILPKDFKEYYTSVNGMKSLYPNYTDNEGFLFYPIEEIFKVKKSATENKDIFVFSEYMHASWWYGLELLENDNYRIGIIPDINSFKSITNSLADFIELYLKDSPIIYDYSNG